MIMQNEVFTFKLNSKLISGMREIKVRYPEKYSSDSHFIRVAIIKLLRDEGISIN